VVNYRVEENNIRGKRREEKETVHREGGGWRKCRVYS
jgi:hypothetical protein